MMAKIGTTSAVFILLIAYLAICSGQRVSYSKRYANGLDLPPTDVFKPIPGLRFMAFLANSSILVNYQITMKTENAEVFTMLTMDNVRVGSIAHSGHQAYKTLTGFYMTNVEEYKLYTFQVHYKSPVPIYMPADLDWETGILQAITFTDAHAVSDGIKCPTSTNDYNNWGRIRDVEAVLNLPEDRAVLSAYQLSAEPDAPGMWVTSLVVDSFFYNTATIIKGDDNFLDLHGAWARKLYAGPHYFNIHYRTPYASELTDCTSAGFPNHKNLYAMMLPSTCQVAAVIRPETTFTFSDSNEWAPTDVTYTLELPEKSNVFVMYQYSGHTGGSYIAMRLNFDGQPQNETASISGDTEYAGNFNLWVNFCNPGSYKIVLEYRSPGVSVNTVSSDLEWDRFNKWMNRAMTVITCRR